MQVTFGGVEDDPLTGSAFADKLFGGVGDDTLAGGLGDDWLEGGVGEDQYLFGASDGKDTIVDVDGEGTVTINGTAQGTGQADVWALKLVDGTHMELTRRTLPPEDGTAGTDSLVISRKSDSANEVRIEGFDFDAAFKNGYLGIKLDTTPKLVLKAGRGPNPWRGPDFDPATLAGYEAIRSASQNPYSMDAFVRT